MKFAIVFALVVAVAVAAPQSEESKATLVRSDVVPNTDGTYNVNVETSNGIKQQESGQLKSVAGAESPVIVASGSFAYPSPDGSGLVSLQYTADENGFHPIGQHLPVPVRA